MKTYSITEQQLQELLKKQRELCVSAYLKEKIIPLEEGAILNAPSPSIEELSGDASFDWEGLLMGMLDDKDFDLMFSSNPYEAVINWLKNNLTKYIK